MPLNLAILILFLSQIYFISVFLPMRHLKQLRQIITKYPPIEYSKLYPVPVSVIETKLRKYSWLNAAIVLLGLIVIIYGISSDAKQMLHWDNKSVLTIYFLLQMVPFVLLDLSWIKHLKLMREVDGNSKRSAELTPRRLFDFVSPIYVWAAVAAYIAHALIVVYISQNPFEGFGGYWNIVGSTTLNLIFIAGIAMTLRGKKLDPHQSSEDRTQQMARIVTVLVVTSIAASLLLSSSLVLSALDLRHLEDIFMVFYFQIIAVLSVGKYLGSQVNFDVYRTADTSCQ